MSSVWDLPWTSLVWSCIKQVFVCFSFSMYEMQSSIWLRTLISDPDVLGHSGVKTASVPSVVWIPAVLCTQHSGMQMLAWEACLSQGLSLGFLITIINTMYTQNDQWISIRSTESCIAALPLQFCSLPSLHCYKSVWKLSIIKWKQRFHFQVEGAASFKVPRIAQLVQTLGVSFCGPCCYCKHIL